MNIGWKIQIQAIKKNICFSKFWVVSCESGFKVSENFVFTKFDLGNLISSECHAVVVTEKIQES